LNGWPLAITLIGGALFASLTILLNQLQQWQQQQASKLDITVATIPKKLELHSFYDSSEHLSTQIEQERSNCLSWLYRTKETNVPKEPRKSSGTRKNNPDAPTVGQIIDIENRLEAGEDITDEEREQLAAAKAHLQDAFKGLFKETDSLKFEHFFGEQDQRSESDYVAEVETYLESYSNFLNEHLLASYITHGLGQLRVTIANKTDRIFTGVEIHLKTSHRVNAFEPEDVDGSNLARPERPRPFGTRRKPWSDSDRARLLSGSRWLMPRTPGIPKHGTLIKNGESVHIIFEPVTIRPHSTENLDVLTFVTSEPPGTEIQLEWDATATNADGRIRGTVELTVSEQPLPIEELLQNVPDGD